MPPFSLLQPRSLHDGSRRIPTTDALFGDGLAPRVVETCAAETLGCALPVEVGQTDAEMRFFLGQPADTFDGTYRFGPSHMAAFPEARVVMPGALALTHDRFAVAETWTGDPRGRMQAHVRAQTLRLDLDGQPTRLPFLLLREPSEIARHDVPAYLLPTYWHFNYHHGLLDVLPRLRHVLEDPALADCAVAVPARLATWQADALDLLGLPERRRLPLAAPVTAFRRLIVPEMPPMRPADLAWLRRRALDAVGTAGAEPDVRLYVSRADADGRRLANEAALRPVLEAQGFRVVRLAGMPFAEQVALFARARLIVGPHGAGLSNQVFSPPGAAVLELMPHDEVNHCFWVLANALRHRYGFLTGPPTAPRRDFTIPPDRILAAVDRLLSSSPT